MLSPVATPAGGLAEAVALLRGRRVTALTGAGISTESGIPDYRGPSTRARARFVPDGVPLVRRFVPDGVPLVRRFVPDGVPLVRRHPIQHGQFVRDAAARRRYWARSVIGWPRVAAAEPNAAHAALAAMERGGALAGIVTQNVDRLHARAGSLRVIELHGALSDVACLDCGAREARADLQRRLLAMNPGFASRSAELAPDGDADLPAALVDAFVVADCVDCRGVLKPDVVFFGGSVARDVVDAAYALVEAAEALLVVGSSLEVYSGFRFVRRAAERAIPVAIVNLGPTRGDGLAAIRWDERACAALPALVAALAA